LGDLRLQHGGELLERRRPRVALGDVVKKLLRALVVLRRRANQRVEHRQANAIRIGALASERGRGGGEFPPLLISRHRAIALQVGQKRDELLVLGRLRGASTRRRRGGLSRRLAQRFGGRRSDRW